MNEGKNRSSPDPLPDDSFSAQRQQMVQMQIYRRGIRDPKILLSLQRIPRHLFVPQNQVIRAYDDCPLSIGFGQTISQPYIVAYMSEKLELSGSEKVLEIGTGSGYQSAVLAENAHDLFTIEIVPELADRAKALLDGLGYTNIHYRIGRGQEGWKDHAPFDRIILTAAPNTVPPPLLDQLALGGILLAPAGTFIQKLILHRKQNDHIDKNELLAVSFVPLVDG